MGLRHRDDGGRARPVGRAAAGLVVLTVVAVSAAVRGDIGELRTTLASMDTRLLAAVTAAAVAVLLLRGVALWVLLDVLGYPTPLGRAVCAYTATVAVSTVVPGGQVGGAPINGALVSEFSEADYEDGVATVAATAALSNAAVATFGVFGVWYLLATATGRGGVVALAALGSGLFALAAAVLVGLWRVRDRAGAAVAAAVTRAGHAAAVIPRVSPPDRDTVDHRLDRFGDAVGRFQAVSLRQLIALLVLFGSAHALTVVALWTSFSAVGHPVSVAVIAAVIPAGVTTAVVPTPGGFGTVEVALATLLAAGTSASAPVAGAAVAGYQVVMTAPALLIGGTVVAVLMSVGWLDRSSLDHK